MKSGKVLILVLVMVLAMSLLVACGEKDKDEETTLSYEASRVAEAMEKGIGEDMAMRYIEYEPFEITQGKTIDKVNNFTECKIVNHSINKSDRTDTVTFECKARRYMDLFEFTLDVTYKFENDSWDVVEIKPNLIKNDKTEGYAITFDKEKILNDLKAEDRFVCRGYSDIMYTNSNIMSVEISEEIVKSETEKNFKAIVVAEKDGGYLTSEIEVGYYYESLDDLWKLGFYNDGKIVNCKPAAVGTWVGTCPKGYKYTIVVNDDYDPENYYHNTALVTVEAPTGLYEFKTCVDCRYYESEGKTTFDSDGTEWIKQPVYNGDVCTAFAGVVVGDTIELDKVWIDMTLTRKQ